MACWRILKIDLGSCGELISLMLLRCICGAIKPQLRMSVTGYGANAIAAWQCYTYRRLDAEFLRRRKAQKVRAMTTENKSKVLEGRIWVRELRHA